MRFKLPLLTMCVLGGLSMAACCTLTPEKIESLRQEAILARSFANDVAEGKASEKAVITYTENAAQARAIDAGLPKVFDPTEKLPPSQFGQ